MSGVPGKRTSDPALLATKCKKARSDGECSARAAASSLHPSNQTRTSISNAGYWCGLCPALHIADVGYASRVQRGWAPAPGCLETASGVEGRQYRQEGYCSADVSWGVDIRALAEGVAALVAQGWHPLWILVFDEAWLLPLRLLPVVRRLCGDRLVFNGDCFGWFVKPGEPGWELHRDRGGSGVRAAAEYITAWVALSDALPANGCMYVVPADLDPTYLTDQDSSDHCVEDVRAVPAPQGTVVMWSGRLLHYGGRGSAIASQKPRISLAFAFSTPEFEGADLRLGSFVLDDALVPSSPLPSLADRLKLIAVQHFLNEDRVPLPPYLANLLEKL